MESKRLVGKVAVVTGASKGIGAGIAKQLAAEGAAVVVNYASSKEGAGQVVNEIAAHGGKAIAVQGDVAKTEDIERLFAEASKAFGRLDILVNNAGTSSAAGFEQVDDATWQYDFDSKVMGAIRFCRLVIPHMKRRGGGRIINVTTVGGKAPAARSLPTSLSRAAGINLTKSLAHEYAADRILVNTICLGLVKSAQHERRAKGDLDAHYREIAEKRKLPLGRFGEASEFADLVAFLASERAAYITGTAINFDGGLTTAV